MLLGPGEGLDPLDLQDVDPAALLNWSQGETAYRERRLDEALGFFDRALATDSTLALAALGGAKAASWSAEDTRARDLISVALNHESRLPSRFVPIARGLDWYLRGQADSAVHYLRSALDQWPESADTWALLGDVYNGIVLAPHAMDSARAAYAMAHRYRPDFAPALQMLALFSALDGEIDQSRAFFERFQDSNPDAETVFRLGIILQCVQEGAGAVPWPDLVRENPTQVLLAGYLMAAGASQPTCAEPALRSLLTLGPAETSERWSAVLTLQSLLVAQGRYEELPPVLAAEPSGRYLYLVDAAAGVPVQDSARSVAADLLSNLESRGSSELWILGQYYFSVQDTETFSALAAQLRDKASTSQSRQVQLLSEAMSALELVALGDSSLAMDQLTGLRPNGTLAEIQWRPWESLASEWMELARLHLAAGNPAEAIIVLNRLDHPRPVINLVFLPPSLRLRIEAAEQLFDEGLAASYRSRLSALQAHSYHGVDPPPESPDTR